MISRLARVGWVAVVVAGGCTTLIGLDDEFVLDKGEGEGGSGWIDITSSNSGAGGSVGGAGGAGGGAGGSAGGSGGSAPAGGYCGKGCAMPVDCCPMGAINCPSDMYPNNWTCDSGACGAPQCSVKDDCTFMGALPDYDCLTLDSKKYCFEGCASDADCTAPLKCIGTDDGGAKYCTVEPSGGGCTTDADCNGFGKCKDKACVCDADTDCTAMGVDKCIK